MTETAARRNLAVLLADVTAATTGLLVAANLLTYLPVALVHALLSAVAPDPDPFLTTAAIALSLLGVSASAAAGLAAARGVHQRILRRILNFSPLLPTQRKGPEAQ